MNEKLTDKEKQARKMAAGLSLIVGYALMAAKFWAYYLTGSQAIFSDAMESIVNVVAAGLALIVIIYASRPADQDHPYGHGKIEFFSAAFEGGLISFAGLFIMIDAVRALVEGQTLNQLGLGVTVVAIAGVVNLGLGLYLQNVGRKQKSDALIASGKHVISDFITSVAVVAGLAVVWATGLIWLDPVIAIAVGIHLIWSGVKIGRESISGLMDEENVEVIEELKQIFERCLGDGIIQIHHLKVIRSGWYHHIDAHLVIPQFWDVSTVHDEITRFEKAVINHYEYGGEMNFHIDPCRQAYCRHCPLKNCEIRKEPFQQRLPIRLDDLRSPVEPENFRPY